MCYSPSLPAHLTPLAPPPLFWQELVFEPNPMKMDFQRHRAAQGVYDLKTEYEVMLYGNQVCVGGGQGE